MFKDCLYFIVVWYFGYLHQDVAESFIICHLKYLNQCMIYNLISYGTLGYLHNIELLPICNLSSLPPKSHHKITKFLHQLHPSLASQSSSTFQSLKLIIHLSQVLLNKACAQDRKKQTRTLTSTAS